MAASQPFHSVDQVEQLVDELAMLEPHTEEYRACVVLLTANSRGANLQDIAEFTGYDGRFLARIDRNCRRSQMWQGDTAHNAWDDENAAESLLLDVKVALGKLERRLAPREH